MTRAKFRAFTQLADGFHQLGNKASAERRGVITRYRDRAAAQARPARRADQHEHDPRCTSSSARRRRRPAMGEKMTDDDRGVAGGRRQGRRSGCSAAATPGGTARSEATATCTTRSSGCCSSTASTRARGFPRVTPEVHRTEAVIHSTSWRPHGPTVVLTYMAVVRTARVRAGDVAGRRAGHRGAAGGGREGRRRTARPRCPCQGGSTSPCTAAAPGVPGGPWRRRRDGRGTGRELAAAPGTARARAGRDVQRAARG